MLCWGSLLSQHNIQKKEKTVDSLLALSDTYYGQGEFTKSIQERKKTTAYLKELEKWPEFVNQCNYIYVIANANKDLEEMAAALDSAYTYATSMLSKEDPAYLFTTSNLGFEELENTNYGKAILYLNEAVQGFEKSETELPMYFNTVTNLLKAYQQKGENAKAIDLATYYYKKSKDHKATMKSQSLFFLLQKAISQRNNAEYRKAILTLNSALNENNALTDEKLKFKNKHTYLRILANTYHQYGKQDTALQFINESIEIKRKATKKIRYVDFSAKGNILFKQNKFSESLDSYKNGLAHYKSLKIQKPKTLASLESKIAECYLHLDNLDSAQQYSFYAAKHLDIPLDKKYDSYNDYLTGSSFNLNHVKILSRIAESSLADYNKNKNEKSRNVALKRYEQAFRGTKYLYKEISSPSDKIQLNSNLQNYFSKYLNLLIGLYQEKGDTELLNKIFQIIEDNKAIVLKEDILQKKHLGLAEIPDEISEQEAKFRLDINNLQRKIHSQDKLKTDNKKMKAQWEKELTQTKITYSRFQSKLKKEYPSFYQSSYSINDSDLHALKEELQNDDCYLNYFDTGDKLICVQISKETQVLHTFPSLDSIDFLLSPYLQLLHQKPESNFSKSDLIRFANLGSALYSSIIPQDLGSYNNIIISPYAQLHYLPFETLLTNLDKNVRSFKSLPYFLHMASIQYAFSSDLFLQSIQNNAFKNDLQVISYAPFVEKITEEKETISQTNRDLGLLKCSDDELNAISKNFKNTELINNAASLQSFKKNIDYDIIHLATHGSLDDQNSSFNKLYFSDDYLAVQEVSDIEFKASLVVLSACNTAMGNIKSGEGVMHLGRGFRKAGVHSIIHSLWTLNDCTTAELIGSFYTRLKQKNIASSLQESKIQYLSQADNQTAHPYYWAGLIFSGNSDVFIKPQRNFSYGFIILSFLILSIFSFFYFKSLKP